MTLHLFVIFLAISFIPKVSADVGGLNFPLIVVAVSFFSILFLVAICCCCKRKSTQGQVLRPTQTTSVPLVNQQTYPSASSYYAQLPNNGSVIAYPPENYTAPSSAQYNTQPEYYTQPEYNTHSEYNMQSQYNTQSQYDTQPGYSAQLQCNTEEHQYTHHHYQPAEASVWQKPGKQASAPPPSYDEVMK
ncbi:angiomotin-like [Saccostrea cucullata]|uniref:angiomotin-like n=1 Tax=Saccostrea cuccullata TaxID=36930 RepID=UPI002ED1C8B4